MPDFSSLDELLEHHKLPFTLRGDQFDTCDELSQYDRIGLFAEVGCGKTAMATVISLAWDADHDIVLMPPILIRQWTRWLNSVANAGPVLAYRGTPAQRKELLKTITQYRWILMSKEIFKNDLALLGKALTGRRLTCIADEAHAYKNPGSKSYKALRDFFMGHNLQMLTGTPLSTPMDAYAYVKLKTPSVYRSQQQFENLHVASRDFFGNITEWQNLELMQQNLMLQSVRLLTADVLAHLHKPNYIPVVYDLAPEHKALYDQIADEQLLLLPDGGKIDATSAGKLYNVMQQIVVNWDYFSGDPGCRSSAFDVIDQVMDETNAADASLLPDGKPAFSKLIVFTYYKMTSRKVTEYLKKYGAVACYSDVPKTQQEDNIDRFMTDPSCRVLVAQPTSAGFGLNPQHCCWEVLFIEEPVVPKDFHQGVGRIYRDGQEHVPNVRLAIAEGTIQHRLHHRLLAKDALVNKVQGGYEDLRDAIHGL